MIHCRDSILKTAIFLLAALFTLGLTSTAFGQVGGPAVKANFGVDADVYADTTQFIPSVVGTGTDDWFDRKTGGGFTGLGVIDVSDSAALRAALQGAANSLQRNRAFVRRQSQPISTVVNGMLWFVAVYA